VHSSAAAVAEPREANRSVPKVELRGLSQVFGGAVVALENVSVAIPERRFVSILGPSGCGKSTIFNIVAGLLKPTRGDVFLDGQSITGKVGFVGYMLQKDMLLPWRSVLDNVILGMEIQGTSKAAARRRAMHYLEHYGLAGFEDKYPAVLSGGMRQRAALLRTLLYDCDLILLDEPFGALDAQMRFRMQQWLLRLWADTNKTVVFVTHDIEEAVYLSDQVIVMSARPGQIKAVVDVPLPRPRPRETLDDPRFLELKRKCVELLAGEDGSEDTDSAPATPVSRQTAAEVPQRATPGSRPRGHTLLVERRWPAWRVGLWQLGVVLAMLCGWQLAATVHLIDPFFWSYPGAILEKFRLFLDSGGALTDTWVTLQETLLAFVLGTASGTLIGLSFWWSRNYSAVMQPFLICIEAVPKLALAPLIVLIFGLGLASKVAVGVALTVVVTTLTTFAAVRAIDPDSERLLYSLGASRWQVFRKLAVPSVLPWIISSLRINIGLALTGAVIGEFVASEHGLGRQILYASQIYDTGLIWVVIFILAALSIVMFLAVGQLEKLLLRSLMHGSNVR
jgi:NitT/TauT family transport system permease protein